ncbi:MAG: ABC transporter permease [Muribaculaceae bacterium]|nr:ABC transporter permease [Muribaculaceae bacterium]
MSKLQIIIANEVKNDVMAKSFWIATFVVPIVILAFGIFAGFMMQDANTFMSATNGMNAGPDPEEMTALKALGMMLGIFPVMFLMMYGTMVFNKVKTEKCNRIVEILATCVEGRTMMMAKIIAVGIVGLFQLALWMVLIIVFGVFFILVTGVGIPWDVFFNRDLWLAFMWAFLYFIGGYVFYASLYAAVGAMTDKNNENQGYITLLTLGILASFYIGEYAVDHASGAFIIACSFIPFTSSTVLTVTSAAKEAPLWLSLTGLAALYIFALLSVSLAGKIYTSSLLLKGKKLSPRDLVTFMKSK